MKIAVIAANGRSGTSFVDAAIAAGHTIRAGIHGYSRLVPAERLEIIPCDATQPAELKALIWGCDAVVSLIGHVKGSAPRVQTAAINNLIDAMIELHIPRVISLTGTGVRFPVDIITLTDRILNLSISLIDPNRVRDGIEHVAALKSSDLDWTVIRVLKLQNVPARPYRLSANGPTKPYVGRDEVAQAILEVLTKASFIKEAPIIARV
jgi:nucleoside-diphosphate-sugar epimerase